MGFVVLMQDGEVIPTPTLQCWHWSCFGAVVFFLSSAILGNDDTRMAVTETVQQLSESFSDLLGILLGLKLQAPVASHIP